MVPRRILMDESYQGGAVEDRVDVVSVGRLGGRRQPTFLHRQIEEAVVEGNDAVERRREFWRRCDHPSAEYWGSGAVGAQLYRGSHRAIRDVVKPIVVI